MLNNCTLMGRLTADPTLRSTGGGVPVTSFTLACDRDFGGKEEKQTDFIDCVAFRNTAEYVARNFSKGRMAIVSGRLQIRDWTDKDNNKRRSAEVVAASVYFGDSKRNDAAVSPTATAGGGFGVGDYSDVPDGELPF